MIISISVGSTTLGSKILMKLSLRIGGVRQHEEGKNLGGLSTILHRMN